MDRLEKIKIFWLAIAVLAFGAVIITAWGLQAQPQALEVSSMSAAVTVWPYQCIDTVKFSRDTARDWQGKEDRLVEVINSQMRAIKDLGANCVAIDTPYDDEFLPFLSEWVSAARQNNLKVWFRGNFAGWEGWFSYPKLSSAEQHNQKTFALITNHSNLFADGDIFTPAPEAENGILGNPFVSDNNKQALLDFLPSSYANCTAAFRQIGKSVICGYFSVNGNVAKEILTPGTIQKTGSVVTIDHYVDSPEKMSLDLDYLNKSLSSKIALGEFGAPIPDINGSLDEAQQAEFVKKLLVVFYNHKEVIAAVNYWTLQGGTTGLLRDDGSLKPVAQVVKNYFQPALVKGTISDFFGSKLSGVRVGMLGSTFSAATDAQGNFQLPLPAGEVTLVFNKPGFGLIQKSFTLTPNTLYTLNLHLPYTFAGVIGR